MAKTKHRIRITGEVLPPGSLPPNLEHPHRHETPAQRWAVIVRAAADILLQTARKRKLRASSDLK